MIRSWIAWLLPQDEYKRQKVLYFIAEGAMLSCIIFFTACTFQIFFDFDDETWLLIFFFSSAIFPLYTTMRYILSGIEYANVDGEEDKTAKKTALLRSTIIGSLIFLLSNILYKPFASYSWLDIIGKTAFFALFWYIAGYISLSRSIRKNKQLDE